MSNSSDAVENTEEKISEEALAEAEVRAMEKRLALLEKGAALSVARSRQGKG